MRAGSSADRLRSQIRADRQRIARGDRPLYHATWATSPDGTADVKIRELPIIHLFVPDPSGVPDGARGLIARTLAVDAASFDLVTEEPTLSGPST
jgi:hypothetical protein